MKRLLVLLALATGTGWCASSTTYTSSTIIDMDKILNAEPDYVEFTKISFATKSYVERLEGRVATLEAVVREFEGHLAKEDVLWSDYKWKYSPERKKMIEEDTK